MGRLSLDNLMYYLSVLAILMSGMVSIFRYGSYIAILIQLTIAIICFCYFRKNIFNNSSLYYLISFLILAIVNFCFHFPFENNMLIGSIVEIIAAFLIISQLEFLKFKKVWLNLITLIALYSIIIYLLVFLDLIGVQSIITKDNKQFIMSYGTVFGWIVKSVRLSGFYHEPGAFQIYLNFTLLFYIQDMYSFSLNKNQFFKLFIVVIALLLTQSTMGYIVFALIIGIVFLKSKFAQSKRIITIPIVIFVLAIFFFKIASSDVVMNKFSGDQTSVSLMTRSSDNFAMLQMIKESPLVGYGVGSEAYMKRSVNYGNATSSNGWLSFSAGFGLPWFLLFLIGTYKAVSRMDLGIPVLLSLFIILLLHANENYTHFVSAYVFILMFHKYD